MKSNRGRVFLKDVAKAAGVSITTVSRILSDSGGPYLEETRLAVENAARRLGYSPKQSPAQQTDHAAQTIAIAVGDLPTLAYPTTLSYGAVFDVLVAVVRGLSGLSAVAIPVNSPDVSEAVFQIESVSAAGVLLVGSRPVMRLLYSALDPELPIVFVNPVPGELSETEVKDRPLCAVTTDRARGTELAVNHLVALGHKRIAISAAMLGTDKYAGYEETMQRHRLPVTEDLIISPELRIDMADGASMGQAAADHILNMLYPPTAVIAANDPMALGLMSGLQQAGWRVPDDLSVVGWDGLELSDYCRSGREPVGGLASGGPPATRRRPRRAFFNSSQLNG